MSIEDPGCCESFQHGAMQYYYLTETHIIGAPCSGFLEMGFHCA